MDELISLGDEINLSPDSNIIFAISFLPEDVEKRWDRSGMLADLIGNYLGENFSYRGKNILGFIVNELVENSVKFSRNKSKNVQLEIYNPKESIIIKITNSISVEAKNHFEKEIQSIFYGNPDDLYKMRIEENSSAKEKERKGIGLLILKKDYKIKMSFGFYKDESSLYNVFVVIEIPLVDLN